ncbi:glycosyltransferase family 4 protein [Sphingorhabdus buctiana]|uniref:Glycosyltransferase family 4 protein n=1 Tax=Sphingorhabdus buctiana TaxID=1508805 RepID=A0ABW4MCU0_9SPHN
MGELRLGIKASVAVLSLRPKASLVIISSPAYLTALILAFAARARSLPYILEIRDIYPEVYSGAGLIREGSLVFAILSRLSNSMYSGASHIIAATDGLARHIAARVDNGKVSCVYNGFPETLLNLEIRKNKRFTLCFHGVMGYFQDVDTLVAVARAVESHQIDVLVIGYGRKEIILKDAPDNLHFAGRLPFLETIKAISACHVGLCLRIDDPISQDSFPVKVWEYIGLGIPAIITPHCEAGAFVERHQCGFQIETGNIETILGKILDLRNNRMRLEELSQNCRKIAPAFTREKAGIKIANIVYNQKLD